jgi:hypothetical protein
MPVDPTLMPSIPNPQQQVLQRVAALEARTRALESKRDPVFTPIAGLSLSPYPRFSYYGGRLWIAYGGSVNTTAAGTGAFDIQLNGVKLTTVQYQAWGAINIAPVPWWVVRVNDTSTLTAGSTNNIISVPDTTYTGVTSLPNVAALLIEAPVP